MRSMLLRLFRNIGVHERPEQLIDAEVAAFLQTHPFVKAKGDRRCLSDRVLFFRSPGSHRHGYYRHTISRDPHDSLCLLNARSRLGGAYDHSFHFDCEPVSGTLSKHYPNCHNQNASPKREHVNIAPNDYVI